jgi:hypothetical protein
MAFAHLTVRESLRDIEACLLRSHQSGAVCAGGGGGGASQRGASTNGERAMEGRRSSSSRQDRQTIGRMKGASVKNAQAQFK